LRSNSATNFYQRFGILTDQGNFPETVIIESGRVNRDDIENCDVAVANIQQIAGEENRWLDGVCTENLIRVDGAMESAKLAE
jgi:hypothetical protein